MKDRVESLRESFHCPKCRGQQAHVDRATLTLSGGRFFPMKPGRFLVVTCALCGFTEFYDMSLFAEERQAAAEETPAAIPNPQKGIP